MKLYHLQNTDGPRETVTQSEVKSEREKQILHINTRMWNLEKWYK